MLIRCPSQKQDISILMGGQVDWPDGYPLPSRRTGRAIFKIQPRSDPAAASPRTTPPAAAKYRAPLLARVLPVGVRALPRDGEDFAGIPGAIRLGAGRDVDPNRPRGRGARVQSARGVAGENER